MSRSCHFRWTEDAQAGVCRATMSLDCGAGARQVRGCRRPSTGASCATCAIDTEHVLLPSWPGIMLETRRVSHAGRYAGTSRNAGVLSHPADGYNGSRRLRMPHSATLKRNSWGAWHDPVSVRKARPAGLRSFTGLGDWAPLAAATYKTMRQAFTATCLGMSGAAPEPKSSPAQPRKSRSGAGCRMWHCSPPE